MADERLVTNRRRRATKTGVVLSHDLIVRTAIRLVQEHGATGLSMRRLGGMLGADPTSIYRYFRSVDDLVRAMADDLMGRCLDGFDPDLPLRAALHDLGLRVYSALVANPRIASLTAARVTGRPNEIRIIETGLGVLRAAGFPPDEAARHYHAFIDLTLGLAALDATALTLAQTAGQPDVLAWETVYAHLDGATHPHIAASAGALGRTMRVSAYPWALEVFLDGLEARR
ncbi:TetR/AcrR family transcriptional regulator [Kineosporia babensis]|uniref:TetR/AcrR family transcriptional regulator n=1 Tax=Kineosporia babensis TaxID=499548 RepID=A0A9X1NMX2_9ACTN|nr:TetR/AcrR family transcriptional regulator [Kineosporia babensis]MCD5316056.1 TetR/AcrR family transcriptional regulator [Kineosporia babensis]